MIYSVYGKDNCSYCTKAKNLLESKGLEFVYIDIKDPFTSGLMQDLVSTATGTQAKTIPQIFRIVHDEMQYIGGFTELLESLKPQEDNVFDSIEL